MNSQAMYRSISRCNRSNFENSFVGQTAMLAWEMSKYFKQSLVSPCSSPYKSSFGGGASHIEQK
jgi:hypothetical protein